MNYVIGQESIAHTYGNVTCAMVDFIKKQFPENFFKSVVVSSSIAFREIEQFTGKRNFLKKRKPVLYIRPRIDLNESDVFMYNTMLTTRITDSFVDLDWNNLMPFMQGQHKEFFTKYLMNRIRMNFDIVMIFSTRMQQMNAALYFKNMVRQDRPFMIETNLESIIPPEIINVISADNKIPVFDKDGSVKPFLDFMNRQSLYPISYKLKNSSGNDEFFRFHPVNIDTSILGLDADEGSKKGMVEDAATITFTISAEFNTSGLYYYFTSSDVIADMDVAIKIEEPEGDKIIPLFTVSNIFKEEIPIGYNVYTAPLYKVETMNAPDVMDISMLFNPETKTLIEYHKIHGLSYDLFLSYKVLKDNATLPQDMWEVNIDEMTLTTKKVNLDSTYRFIIYIKTGYTNELLRRIFELDEEK